MAKTADPRACPGKNKTSLTVLSVFVAPFFGGDVTKFAIILANSLISLYFRKQKINRYANSARENPSRQWEK